VTFQDRRRAGRAEPPAKKNRHDAAEQEQMPDGADTGREVCLLLFFFAHYPQAQNERDEW